MECSKLDFLRPGYLGFVLLALTLLLLSTQVAAALTIDDFQVVERTIQDSHKNKLTHPHQICNLN